MEFSNSGTWSRKGKRVFFWVTRWPGDRLAIGGVRGRLLKATLMATGKELNFVQGKDRIILTGLPKACPDKVAGVSPIALDFAQVPYQQLGCGYEYVEPVRTAGKQHSPFAAKWRLSPLGTRPAGGIAAARYAKPAGGWADIEGNNVGFIQVHDRFSERDGMVYLANRFRVPKAGPWVAWLGHDGGAKVFVDGKEVFCEPACVNPADPWRSRIALDLARGVREIVVALDTAAGKGWGIFFRWEQADRSGKSKPSFPRELAG